MLKHTLFFLILIFVGCSDDSGNDMPESTAPLCEDKDLEVRVQGNSCEVANSIGICDVLTIEETKYIDEITYDWVPNICSYEVDDRITFKNGNNTTDWKVVDRHHYVAKEGVYGSCGDTWHSSTLICQKNEIYRVSLVSTALGILDTLQLELRTRTLSDTDGTPDEKRNVVGLWQDRAFTNIANFWINHYVGDDYYEQTWQSYNETVTLNGKEYPDVLKYEYGDHIHDEPHHRFYMQHGVGILAFEVDDRLWVRE